MDFMKENYNRNELLQYPNSLEQAIGIQKKWAKFVSKENAPGIELGDINLVAGVDLVYLEDDINEYGFACAVLWDVKEQQEVSHEFSTGKVEFPYISGLLAFREILIASKALEKLSPQPDVLFFDGHGRAHPHRFGAATAIGVAMNIPSIGVAKKPLINVHDWKKIERKVGKTIPIIDEEETIGYVIVLKDKSSPVFVSVGYRIKLDTAVKLTLTTAKTHKQPESLGRAHDYLQTQKYDLFNEIIKK
ncbi:MAG: endonuclease V [Candidatus Lokiarchaeota archaeon]|nr:endonuclease V [Candidatus Lokiarchaeota archaeon]